MGDQSKLSPKQIENIKHLIPLNKRTKEERQAIGRKGGQKKSLKKSMQCYLNGLNNRKLSERDKYLLMLMNNKQYGEVVTELIKQTVSESEDPVRRDKAVEQLQRMLPQKVLQINANVNEVIPEDVFDFEEHLKKIKGKEEKGK